MTLTRNELQRKSEGAMTPIHSNHPVRKAWATYQQTESYKNSLKWASYEEHRDGSMWAVFLQGWQAYESHCLVPVEYDREGGKTLMEWREGDAPTSAQVQDDMRHTIDLLRRAARLIHRRHAMVSGGLEMVECDSVCKEAGLEVWTWPSVRPLLVEYVTPLDAVFVALADASNALDDVDEGSKEMCVYTTLRETLDKAIDTSLRICQAWREEEKDRDADRI